MYLVEHKEKCQIVFCTLKPVSHKICLRFSFNSGFVCPWVLSLQDSYPWVGETNGEVDECAAKMMSPKWNSERAVKFSVANTCFRERVTVEGKKLWEKYSLFIHLPPWDCTWRGRSRIHSWREMIVLSFQLSGLLYIVIFLATEKLKRLIPSIKAQPLRKMREFTFCAGWSQLLFWRLMVQSIIIIFSGEHNYAQRV